MIIRISRHCWAGWIVHIAGDAGYTLEKQTSCAFAARQIAKASGYEVSYPDFYLSNEQALKKIRSTQSNQTIHAKKSND